jgi:hypothetical protein
LKNPEVVAKMINTKIKKYGSLLAPCYRFKEFVFPSGRIVKVQGYEDKALILLIQKYSEDNIIVGRKEISAEIGKIYYMNKNTQHIYFPDIYIKSENKIIEVKSSYTYEVHKDINELKKQACIDKGLFFEFLIL